MIEYNLNGHNYKTEKLYYADVKKMGAICEEKILPLILALVGTFNGKYFDKDVITTLYKACKDVFNRDDLEYLSDMAINREHLLIDDKKLDNAEWEKHWQKVGYLDYRAVSLHFMLENLGNFTGLLAQMPTEWAALGKELLGGKFSNIFAKVNSLLRI